MRQVPKTQLPTDHTRLPFDLLDRRAAAGGSFLTLIDNDLSVEVGPLPHPQRQDGTGTFHNHSPRRVLGNDATYYLQSSQTSGRYLPFPGDLSCLCGNMLSTIHFAASGEEEGGRKHSHQLDSLRPPDGTQIVFDIYMETASVEHHDEASQNESSSTNNHTTPNPGHEFPECGTGIIFGMSTLGMRFRLAIGTR